MPAFPELAGVGKAPRTVPASKGIHLARRSSHIVTLAGEAVTSLHLSAKTARAR